MRGTVTSVVSKTKASAATARRRRLHIGHFAFMRSVVQGVDIDASWHRYLHSEGASGDPRQVRKTVVWIREEFAAAARREDRFGTARLVRLDVARIADASMSLPSLEEFAESQGLEDFSQAEQLVAYEQAFGKATARQKRRGRLIARQLEALRWLEGLVAQPPRAGDAVASWLDPALADHLEAADIFTLAQLADRINGLGRTWYAGLRSLGAAKAERILDWLREHEPSTGLGIGVHVGLPRRKLFRHELSAVVQPASDIRPLEKFIVPGALDGSRGLYRRPQEQCLLKATNDYQAILVWLRSKHGLTPEQKTALNARRRQRDNGVEQSLDWLQSLSHTQRAYRKEAERFLLWAIVEKGRALSSMSNEDCIAYREFLADPQPRSRWCGERSRERWSPLWRPFEGPLSPTGQRHAITILKNLYGFLVDQNYLMGNPWSAVGVPRSAVPRVNAGRSLSTGQWDFVQEQLDSLDQHSSNLRLRVALRLLYATGLRLSEVVAAQLDDLQWVSYPADGEDDAIEGWVLRVIGKGQRLREVPVPTGVVDELSAYLMARGFEDPRKGRAQPPGIFLLGKATDAATWAPALHGNEPLDARQGVAATTLYNQIKAFFMGCSKALQRIGDARGAERLAQASTHWLRHSHASHAIAGGMKIEIAQQNLGHASLATTTVYVTTEQKRRMKAVETFWETRRR